MRPGWLIAEVWRAVASSVRGTFDKPHDDDCSDALAYALGAFAVVFTALAFVAAVIR